MHPSASAEGDAPNGGQQEPRCHARCALTALNCSGPAMVVAMPRLGRRALERHEALKMDYMDYRLA